MPGITGLEATKKIGNSMKQFRLLHKLHMLLQVTETLLLRQAAVITSLNLLNRMNYSE